MMTDGHDRRINIVQGEFKVSDDPNVVVTTLLGSCVAACICDPVARVGGMNHFLLPGAEGGSARESERLGVHLMELLLNGLMRQGAQRDRLEAKLFGGARMMSGLSDIGAKNAAFAKRFLAYEGIKVLGGDTGGLQGRRIQFWPVSGRALQSYISQVVETAPPRAAPPRPGAGDVDLF
jgi:chemotaxis protein CheD